MSSNVKKVGGLSILNGISRTRSRSCRTTNGAFVLRTFFISNICSNTTCLIGQCPGRQLSTAISAFIFPLIFLRKICKGPSNTLRGWRKKIGKGMIDPLGQVEQTGIESSRKFPRGLVVPVEWLYVSPSWWLGHRVQAQPETVNTLDNKITAWDHWSRAKARFQASIMWDWARIGRLAQPCHREEFQNLSRFLDSVVKVQSIKVFMTVFYGPFSLENILDLLFS